MQIQYGVELYDTQCKLIQTLFDGQGREDTISIATNDLESGISVIKLRTNQYQSELKLSVMRD